MGKFLFQWGGLESGKMLLYWLCIDLFWRQPLTSLVGVPAPYFRESLAGEFCLSIQICRWKYTPSIQHENTPKNDSEKAKKAIIQKLFCQASRLP